MTSPSFSYGIAHGDIIRNGTFQDGSSQDGLSQNGFALHGTTFSDTALNGTIFSDTIPAGAVQDSTVPDSNMPASLQVVMEQAAVCRSNAREAQRLGRYGAACGLFRTAIALLQFAVNRAEAGGQYNAALTARLCEAQVEARDCGQPRYGESSHVPAGRKFSSAPNPLVPLKTQQDDLTP